MKFFSVIVAIFLYCGVDAQTRSADSLKKAISSAGEDSSKASLLTDLADKLSGTDFKQSIIYAREGLELSEKIGFEKGIIKALGTLGSVYGKQKKSAEAENYFERAEKIAKQARNYEVLRDFYDTYSLYFENKRDYRNAYKYHVLFSNAQDSLRYLSNRLTHLNKTDKAEEGNRAPALKHWPQVSAESLENNKLNLLIVLFISAIVILVLWISRRRLKNKEQTSKELLIQQVIGSRSVIEEEERERSRVARELNDEIGQQLSAAKLNISALQSFLRSTSDTGRQILQNAVNLLDDSVKGVRNVSHSMIPNALIKSGLVSALREFIDKAGVSGSMDIQMEVIGPVQRLEQTKEAVLFRVMQEVINNVIKHARASQVTIQLIKHENELSILVEDNGIGFDAERVLKNNKTTGLKSIQSRVAFLNGSVFFDSRPSKGTTVSIEIPM